MADTYGGITIPLEADDGDPLVDHLLAYLQAVANAHGSAAWAAVAPGDASAGGVVRTVGPYNPERAEFNAKDLPALYCWRDDVTDHVQIAEDMRVERGELVLKWVVPPATQDKRALPRGRFPGKLFKLFDLFVERDRDPTWIVAGDTVDAADVYGSSLGRHARFMRLRIERVRRADLVIRIDGAPTMTFEAYEARAPYEELLVDGLERYPALASVDGTITTGGDDPRDVLEYRLTT